MSLSIKVVKEKYGVRLGCLYYNFSKVAVGCSVWRGLKWIGDLFRLLTRTKVGANNGLSFRLEPWCDQKPLGDLFLGLFRKCLRKDGSIKDFVLGLKVV